MRTIFSFFVILIAVGCHSKSNNHPTQSPLDTVSSATAIAKGTTCNCTDTAVWDRIVKEGPKKERRSTLSYIWYVDLSDKTVLRNPKYKDALLNIDTLLTGINTLYKEMPLEQVKQGHDTLYTHIKNSSYFKSQLDSTNKKFYIAQAVYNLTSIPGVKYVHFAFDDQSVEIKKVWSKNSFKEYRVEN